MNTNPQHIKATVVETAILHRVVRRIKRQVTAFEMAAAAAGEVRRVKENRAVN